MSPPRRFPPGPSFNFLLACWHLLRGRPFDQIAFALSNARTYGDIVYYTFGPLRIYQLSHPDLVRPVLIDDAAKYHKPSVLKWALRSIAPNGLLVSDGDLWRRQRKLMQPSFRHDRLGVYADLITQYAAKMVAEMTPGSVVDIGEKMTRLTLQIVVRAMFGEDLPAEADNIGEVMVTLLDDVNDRFNMPFQLPDWFPTKRNRRTRRARARIELVVQTLIQKHRNSGVESDDLLSLLVAAVDADTGARMSDRQLRDEMMTIFGAGHETTATALTWTWYLLARNPEVESKLAEELDRVLGGRLPTVADLPALTYTEMIVRESMRLYPPASEVGRQPIEDVEIGGYKVPKGSIVTAAIYAMHRDERFFAEPDRFLPERFAPGWTDRIPRCAYMPFGDGPRVCIGNGFAMMEAKLIVATLAQSFRFRLEPDVEIPPYRLVTLRPKTPVMMCARATSRM